MPTFNCAAPGVHIWRRIAGTFQSPLFLSAVPTGLGAPQHVVDANDLPDLQVSAARNVERAGQTYGPVGATEQETGTGQIDGTARRRYRRVGVACGGYVRGGACQRRQCRGKRG
jgi:hypothetical protein